MDQSIAPGLPAEIMSARHVRMRLGVISRSSVAPSAGRMCRRNSPSYNSRVRGRRCGRSASQRDEYSPNVTLPSSGSIHDPQSTSERTEARYASA